MSPSFGDNDCADLMYNDTINDTQYGPVPDDVTLDRERELRRQLELVAQDISFFEVAVGYEILDPRYKLLMQFADKYFANMNAEDFFINNLDCARDGGDNVSASSSDSSSARVLAPLNATESRIIEQAKKRFMDLHLYQKFHASNNDHERILAPNAVDLQLRNGSVVTLKKVRKGKDVTSWEDANIDSETCTSTSLMCASIVSRSIRARDEKVPCSKVASSPSSIPLHCLFHFHAARPLNYLRREAMLSSDPVCMCP